MISIWNINYEDGKVLLETSWFVSMKKTWDITRRESLTCLSITNEEHFNSEQSPNWLQIFFPKNNPSIKTIEYFGCFCRTNCFGVSFLGKFHQIQYSSLRLFFWRIISHAQLWVVCVCVCMWHSLNFNEAVSEINSGFADKLCIQKKWINQIVVK